MRYELLGARLLVRVLEASERTKGGLIIPDIAIEGTPWRLGEVIEAGNGRYMPNGDLVPLIAKKGDIVIFWRSTTPGEQLVFPVDGDDLLCIREDNVLGFVRDLDKTSSLVGRDGKVMLIQ